MVSYRFFSSIFAGLGLRIRIFRLNFFCLNLSGKCRSCSISSSSSSARFWTSFCLESANVSITCIINTSNNQQHRKTLTVALPVSNTCKQSDLQFVKIKLMKQITLLWWNIMKIWNIFIWFCHIKTNTWYILFIRCKSVWRPKISSSSLEYDQTILQDQQKTWNKIPRYKHINQNKPEREGNENQHSQHELSLFFSLSFACAFKTCL